MSIWRELKATPKQEKIINELRETGVGASLPPEKLQQYQTPYEETFSIETRAGECVVHYYRPGITDNALPLLINIHGGGFIKGRRDQDIVFCRKFSSKSGYAVLDIDYVLAPAMRYPGQVYACYDVMLYCVREAEKLKINSDKIVVGGDSAGGNLTAAMILMGIVEGTFTPALQILDYAGFDMVTPPAEKRNGNSNPRIPAERAQFYNEMYVDKDLAPEIYCSPCYAKDEQLAKMPPTVMIYCENDTFCDEAAAFNRKLLALGVPVYAKLFMHSNHGFTVQCKDEYIIAEKMIFDALASLSSVHLK